MAASGRKIPSMISGKGPKECELVFEQPHIVINHENGGHTQFFACSLAHVICFNFLNLGVLTIPVVYGISAKG